MYENVQESYARANTYINNLVVSHTIIILCQYHFVFDSTKLAFEYV